MKISEMIKQRFSRFRRLKALKRFRRQASAARKAKHTQNGLESKTPIVLGFKDQYPKQPTLTT
jgi:hypothetical protein